MAYVMEVMLFPRDTELIKSAQTHKRPLAVRGEGSFVITLLSCRLQMSHICSLQLRRCSPDVGGDENKLIFKKWEYCPKHLLIARGIRMDAIA